MKLPTADECFIFARDLAHEIDPETVDGDGDTLPEEWYIYPENIKKLITFCQTPAQMRRHNSVNKFKTNRLTPFGKG